MIDKTKPDWFMDDTSWSLHRLREATEACIGIIEKVDQSVPFKTHGDPRFGEYNPLVLLHCALIDLAFHDPEHPAVTLGHEVMRGNDGRPTYEVAEELHRYLVVLP